MTAVATQPVEVVANAPAESARSGSTLRFLLALGGVAVVIGGVIWIVRKKGLEGVASAKPLAEGSTPLPDIDPWADLDDLMSQAPQQQTIAADGDGDTAAGLPYIWRIYTATIQGEGQDTSVFQVIVMYETDDGEWGYWGDNPETPRFVIAGTEQLGMDKIAEWGDQN